MSASRTSGEHPNASLVPVLMVATMVVGIISSLGAPLLPAVARSFHISLNSAQWSLTVALLAGAISAPTLGRLGDGRYRREAIIGGLLVVFVGSLIAGFADSLPVLLVGRVMQGAGLGLAPVTMAAARAHLPDERSREVIAVLSVMGAAGVGAGYPISGLIATDVSLHAAFFFGAVLSGVVVCAAAFTIPSSRDDEATPLDARGAVALAAGLTALLIGIAQGQLWGWTSWRTAVAFVVGLVVLAGWVVFQLRLKRPLVDLRQLRHRAVLAANVAAAMLGVSLYMFFTVVTEFIQEPRGGGYGFSASTLTAGLVLVPFSVLGLAASRVTGRATSRLGAETVLIGGSILTAAAAALFALAHGALIDALVAMGVLGVAFGFSFAAIPGMVTGAVAERDTGSAMGLYQVIRSVGFSIGSALAASILAGNLLHGQPTEHGYVLNLWVCSAVALAAAAIAWLLAGRVAVARGAPVTAGHAQLSVDDAELTAAGLVGLEGNETDDFAG
jgi:predicted MFS family arabinose efflux permease